MENLSSIIANGSSEKGNDMRLILNRGQKTTGMMSKSVMFQLTARVDLDETERAALSKYKFGKELVYSKENVAPSGYASRNTWGGIARNLSAAAMNLQLTVDGLVNGRTIECKSISEMLDVEDTIKQGCEVLKGMLSACQTFEGETVMEF